MRDVIRCPSVATLLLIFSAQWFGADSHENPGKVVVQSVPPGVALNPQLPALHLSNAQREQIRKAVVTKHADIEFQLKSTKSAKDFIPSIGATLPKGIKGQALPFEVTAQVPELRSYLYVTMKDQVLIVNGMSHKIVDMFSETRPIQ
jgi:hypothetical protein